MRSPQASRCVPWIAALPMYDYPELAGAHDALWSAISTRLLAAGLVAAPSNLRRDLDHLAGWRHPYLLLGQACEYPLAKSLAGQVRPIATPHYSAPGCEGARYRSAVLVRATDPARELADLRERRCAVNEADSNSGMNLLRAAIAPLAAGRRFFATIRLSGSHRASVRMLTDGEADVAAVDCISLAHLQRCAPASLAALRILCWTPAARCPPFITAGATDEATLRALRAALAGVAADPALAAVRERLLLAKIDLEHDGCYAEALEHERRAAELGYPALV